MQKLKEEAAIKKRNAVRKTTGINSDIDEENTKQHNNHRKTGAKKKEAIEELSTKVVMTAELDEENACNRVEKITTQSTKQRSPDRPQKPSPIISVGPKICSDGENSMRSAEGSELAVDSLPRQNETETVSVRKTIEQQKSDESTITEGRNEIKTNTEVERSFEIVVQKRGVTSLLECASSNGEAAAQKRCKLEKTVDNMHYGCSVNGGLNESSHKYGTRKKQVSFRALLGKK